MNDRIKRLRILSASLFALLVLMTIWNIALRNNNVILMDELSKHQDCEQRIKNTIEHANKAWERVEELESANEALIKHATPQSVERAIKATPLPTMKG